MKHARLAVAAALLVLAAWLGFELWRAQQEYTENQAEISTRKRERAMLRRQLDAVRAARAPAAKIAPEPAGNATAAARAPATPRPIDPRIGSRAEEMVRRNALHSYIAGFNRLRLSPDAVAQAKAVILARWQESANAKKPFHSMAEAIEEADRSDRVMNEQLTALLGADAAAELMSAAREEAIDWSFGTDLWDAGVPLDAGQLHALARAEIQIGYRATTWSLSEEPNQVPDPETGLTRQNADLLAATSGFLSPAQQVALQRSLIEDQQYKAAMRAFGEKQRKLSETQ